MANQPSRVHEFFRKRLVSLKRKPQFIAMFVLVVAFIYYSFNLSSIANTTALINGPHMGLSEFCVMLFSALAGREHGLHAYEVAVENRYRFFSFGDAMFLS